MKRYFAEKPKSRFPLIPVLWRRAADDQNTVAYSFHWAFFSVWTCDAFSLSLRAELEWEHAYVQLTLPYVHVRAGVPLLSWRCSQWLWRKSEMHKRHMKAAERGEQ